MARIGHHIQDRYDVETIYGYRPNAIDMEGHPAGLGLDFMVDRATGDRIAEYLLQNTDEFGIKYVIWRQRLNYGSGWRMMEDRGGSTANHYDHVHVSFHAIPSGFIPLC